VRAQSHLRVQDEANRTIRFEIEASSFPNWKGAKRLRPMTTLTADELTWANPTSSQGATSAVSPGSEPGNQIASAVDMGAAAARASGGLQVEAAPRR
jgi:hypothetical protein